MWPRKLPILFIFITLIAGLTYKVFYLSKDIVAPGGIAVRRRPQQTWAEVSSPPAKLSHYSFKQRKSKKDLVVRNVTIEDGKIFQYYPLIKMEKENDVPIITTKDGCPNKSRPPSSPKEKLQLVTNFIYFKLEKYRSNLWYRFGAVTDDVLDARTIEVLDCLQDNLMHLYIQRIHVLVYEKEAVDFLKRIDFENADKMVIKLTHEPVTMTSQLIYASTCLKNSVVAVCHQDNKFGTGWERLNPAPLMNKKIVYALTRQSNFNRSCEGTKAYNCDPGAWYVGSHDTFVFGVRKGFTPEELKPMLAVTPNLNGMENVLIWVFGKLGYKVTNPCPILHVHHQHCVAVKDKDRIDVRTNTTTGLAWFTNSLD